MANLNRVDADVPVVGPVADECVKLGHRPGGLLARSDDEADVGRNAKSLALACPAAQIARRGPRIRRTPRTGWVRMPVPDRDKTSPRDDSSPATRATREA